MLVYRPIYNSATRIHHTLQARADQHSEPEFPEGAISHCANGSDKKRSSRFVRIQAPLDLNTAPLIAVLFLLATTAIGREEVHDGTLGANNIIPLDIVAFALTIGYITRSIDASGLVRFIAFKVLTRSKNGHRLYLYLYSFFFALGCLFGNDPVIQMGVLFLAYMTRVSTNIEHPRAWIHTQFAVANIGSTVLTSSNTTNLVIAQAFRISFASYTASVIVPVAATAIILFPCLLYFVFANERLIPMIFTMERLPDDLKSKKPIQPHIPNARSQNDGNDSTDEEAHQRFLTLEEIMNPFLDKASALVGVSLMFVTLSILLGLTAAGYNNLQVFWVTLPASFLMLCWDVGMGWRHRHETREIARRGLSEFKARARQRETQLKILQRPMLSLSQNAHQEKRSSEPEVSYQPWGTISKGETSTKFHLGGKVQNAGAFATPVSDQIRSDWPRRASTFPLSGNDLSSCEMRNTRAEVESHEARHRRNSLPSYWGNRPIPIPQHACSTYPHEHNSNTPPQETTSTHKSSTNEHSTIIQQLDMWLKMTLPTAAVVVRHLPFSIVPFALPLFVLVQALASTGWITLLARGWTRWVDRTGTVGAIGGMGFLSVILSNVSPLLLGFAIENKQNTNNYRLQFAGTNIGATILLSRVVQAWQASGSSIPEMTLWGTVYAMAIGVNYGAFSLSFAASLAGLGWRQDLKDKRINVRGLEFARVNLPLIIVCMVISCSVLVGEVYIIWDA